MYSLASAASPGVTGRCLDSRREVARGPRSCTRTPPRAVAQLYTARERRNCKVHLRDHRVGSARVFAALRHSVLVEALQPRSWSSCLCNCVMHVSSCCFPPSGGARTVPIKGRRAVTNVRSRHQALITKACTASCSISRQLSGVGSRPDSPRMQWFKRRSKNDHLNIPSPGD